MISNDVIAKAVETLLCISRENSLLTFDEFIKEKGRNQRFYAQPVNLNAFHQLDCVNGVLGDDETAGLENMEIIIQMLAGRTFTIKSNSITTIDHFKTEIYRLEGIPSDLQRLIFGGHQLHDGTKTLAEYGIIHQSTVHCVLNIPRRFSAPHYVPDEFTYPHFDNDLTGVVDTGLYTRGGFTYNRPCGWYRVALNVLNKYENNAWLGAHRARTTPTSSVAEEWPVSYHGTGEHNSRSIAADGYLLSKGMSFAYGRGIYSTPNIHVAELYARKFTHRSKEFLVVMQNRVNPRSLIRFPILRNSTGLTGEYWVTPTQQDIHPYGICIKPLN